MITLEDRIIPLTRILRAKDVQDLTGLANSTLYNLVREHSFPKPISLGNKCKGWVDSEVQEWIEKCIEQRNEEFGKPDPELYSKKQSPSTFKRHYQV
jgi:prophage regulatory protein